MKKLIILLSLLTISTEKNKIYCDIKGNVKNPGVYEIKENYTVQNIIDDAGGLKKNSYTKNINLSKKVRDEMVIYIFTTNEIKEVEELKNCVCTPTYKYIECESNVENLTTTTKPTTSTTKPVTTKETTTTSTNTTTINSTTTKSRTTNSSTTKNTTTTIKKQTTTKIKTTQKQDNHTSIPTTKTTTTTLRTTEKRTNSIEETLININNATLEELTTLKGLGEKKANAVIEYRKNNGPFKTIEEIMNVSGIGISTYEKIKDYIKV